MLECGPHQNIVFDVDKSEQNRDEYQERFAYEFT